MSNAKASVVPKPQVEVTYACSLDSTVRENALHILHVDDDTTHLQVSKMILESENNFLIDQATSVDSAFKKLQTQSYDVVVSDYEMPQKNGLEFLKGLREHNRNTPFILFTGKGREEVAVKALILGADSYINKNGSPETVFCELADAIKKAVECKKKDLEIAQKNEALERVAESIDSGLAVIGKDYRVFWANKRLRGLGVNPNKKCYQTFNNSQEVCPNCGVKKVFEQKVSFDVHEYQTLNSKGETGWVELRVTPLKDKNGDIMAALELAVPITERKKSEEALRKSEEEYRSLFANMMDGFAYCKMIYDEAGKPVDFVYLQINDAFEKITGLKKEAVIDHKVTEAIPGIKEANPELFEIYGKVATTGKAEKFEIYFKPLSKWLAITVYSPERSYFAAVFEDITTRKLAEDNLKESEAKYQTTFNASMDALMLLDEKGFFECNKATLDLFGCKSVEEFTKFHPADLSPPTQPDGTSSMSAAMGHIQKAFQTGIDHFFWIHKRVNGRVFSADILLTRMTLKGKEVLHATVRDISELRKAEEENKFQADLLNHVGQAIIMVDNNRTIRFWNKAAEKLYGWSEEQALGHKVTELLGIASPEEAAETARRLMAGESWSTEALANNKDGSIVAVILNQTPIYNQGGEFVGAASITTDITLQKNTEADLMYSLESLSNSLDKIKELNEKLRVVGGLTRHDVRNKLSVVNGYTYILKKKHSDQPDIVDGLGKIEQAVLDSAKIFDFAKMYEQLGVEELTYVDIGKAVDEAVALFSGLTLKIVNDCHGKNVLADSFLRQMFYNFIDNTRKYGEKVTIAKVYSEQEESGGLRLVYEDNGVGISAENKPKLFIEGFSTGGSTGFGLFLIKKMTAVYGWTITEEGEPGKGVKFVIRLPAQKR